MRKAGTKTCVTTNFLKAQGVLQFLTLTGRLFHKVAAAFPNTFRLKFTPNIYDTVRGASDSGLRDLLDDTQQQVPLSTERQSQVELYVDRPGSVACMWLETNTAS